MRANLQSRGIELERVEGCEMIAVLIEPENRGLSIAIEPSGVRRTANDPVSAATIIESWVREDVTEPLLSRELPPPVREPFPPEEEESRVEVQLQAPGRRYALGLSGVFGIGGDGSNWWGADLRGCAHLSLVCVGGRAQVSADLGANGQAERLDGDRLLVDLSPTIELPIEFDRIDLSPGVGIGLSIQRTNLDEDRGAPGVTKKLVFGGKVRFQLGLSCWLAPNWSLRLDLAFDWAPFARERIYGEMPDGTRGAELPGEPEVMGWLRAGLEVGG